VIVVGAEGAVRCLELKTGAKRWEVKPLKEYAAPNSYFGAGGSPLVVGKLVLVNTGADRQMAGISAFDLATGKVVWQATREIESYSSPVVAKLKAGPTVVFVTRLNVVGVDPANGRERFRFPFGQRGPTVNGAAPLVFDEHVFVTASYGIGAVLAKIGVDGAKTVWESDEVLSSQYPTPVYHEGFLYGIHGRQDGGPAELRCIDPLTRSVRWKVPDFGMASVVWADGKLVIQKTAGELVLAKASPESFQSLAQGTVGESTVRALPALSAGRWFVRDEQRLRCYDLGAKP
jgi:outer membrane protein assembly factor BamB